jgi:hypothetical protein
MKLLRKVPIVSSPTDCADAAERGLQMKRVLVASVASMALLMQFGVAYAVGISGPFDGQWTGTAKSAVSQCQSANVTVAIEGTIVIGKAQFANDAPNFINGTVRGDGSFGATIGWQPLVGKFSTNGFEGTFRNGDCEWTVHLQRGLSVNVSNWWVVDIIRVGISSARSSWIGTAIEGTFFDLQMTGVSDGLGHTMRFVGLLAPRVQDCAEVQHQ